MNFNVPAVLEVVSNDLIENFIFYYHMLTYMQKERLADTLSFRITMNQRTRLERLSEIEKMSLGEAARTLLDTGMRTKGIA